MQSVEAIHSQSSKPHDLPGARPSIWLFWPLWVLANAVGGAIGAAISGLVAMWQPICSYLLGPAVYIWVPLGLAQGVVLSLYLGRITRPWMIASTIGGFFGVAINIQLAALLILGRLPGEATMAIVAAIGGLGIGFCQAMILEDKVRSPGWWLIVSSLTWAVAMFVEAAFEWHGVTSALFAQADPLGSAATIGIQAVMSGVAMTGIIAETREPHRHPSAIKDISESSDDGTPLAL